MVIVWVNVLFKSTEYSDPLYASAMSCQFVMMIYPSGDVEKK